MASASYVIPGPSGSYNRPPYPGQQGYGAHSQTAYPSTGGHVSAPVQAPSIPVHSNQEKLVMKVEIHVSCNNLRDKDVLSKSDPMVVLFIEESKAWKEFGRTEIVQDDLNPKFTRSFVMDYRFEELQKLKFEVYDCDSESQSLNSHDFLGRLETTLGNVLGENSGHCTKRLYAIDRSAAGTITIDTEQVNDSKEMVTLHLKGRNLDKKDFFGSSDPFLVLFRSGIENEVFTAVHRSEVVKNNLNPIWKQFNISAQTLCNGDQHRPIKVECYDWDSDGTHDFIGHFKTTLHEMKTRASTSYELINPKKKAKKKGYKNSGFIDIIDIETKIIPSFLDYISGGTELCFHVAIDFTASNGNPQDPQSLHYRSPYQPNMYMQALSAVGRIIEDYDSDKIFPGYGFGARINGTVYHDFPLNQQPDPNCSGIDGLLDAYNKSLSVVELYGPTNFSPVINRVARQATASAQDPNGVKYHILLIITDGIITDMDQTKHAIVVASSLPLSIIIVGVGNAVFDAMEELDGDNVNLRSGNRIAERDIVQFVPYRTYIHAGESAGAKLASEVLYEIPQQLVSYMEKRGVKPGAAAKSPKPRPGDNTFPQNFYAGFQSVQNYPGQQFPLPASQSFQSQPPYASPSAPHPRHPAYAGAPYGSTPYGGPQYMVPPAGHYPGSTPPGQYPVGQPGPYQGSPHYLPRPHQYGNVSPYMGRRTPPAFDMAGRSKNAKEAALEAMGRPR